MEKSNKFVEYDAISRAWLLGQFRIHQSNFINYADYHAAIYLITRCSQGTLTPDAIREEWYRHDSEMARWMEEASL